MHEIVEQRAVAAADVEHPAAGRHHVGDMLQIDADGAPHRRRDGSRRPGSRGHDGAHVDAAALGGADQEAAQGRLEFRLVEQEGVVALVALDLDEADIGGDGVERLDHGAALAGREQPVAGEGEEAESHRRAAEGIGQHAALLRRQVEIIHGPGDVEIGIGVEPVDEARALMAQIAFDLEIGVEAIGDAVAVLQGAAELAVQRLLREIGDMGRHAGDGEAAGGIAPLQQIIAAAPVGIGHDGLAPDLMEGDVLGRMARRRGDGHGGEDTLGIGGRPLQRLHAAHGAAGDAEELVDLQMLDQELLGPHHVGDGDDGKAEAVGPPGGGVDVARARSCPCSRPAHCCR